MKLVHQPQAGRVAEQPEAIRNTFDHVQRQRRRSVCCVHGQIVAHIFAIAQLCEM
jgi:hypothetical protein